MLRSSALCLIGLLAASCGSSPETGEAAPIPAWPRHELHRVVEPDGLRTEPIDAPFRFDELVPSWNVRVRGEGGFRVRLRVAREDGAWSPWLDVGDWGVTAGERVTCFDEGHVDVDTFLSVEGHDRAQLEVVPDPADADVVVEHVSLCFTDRDGGAPPRPNAPAPLALVVPFRSQRDAPSELAPRVCSPTSLAMVLAYRGVDASLEQVAERAYDAVHDLYGNWPRAVQAAYTYGVPGWVDRFSEWHQVEEHLRAHGPLVVSIGVEEGQLQGAPYPSTPGHLIVLTGFDENGDVRVNDPAAASEETGRLVYRRRELERVWLHRGGTAYVFVRR